MKNNNFLENLFQTVGFLAAIIISISQYIFSSQFKSLFIGNEHIYFLANTCTLGIALASIVGFYANRHFLESKNYFNTKQEAEYYKKLRETSTKPGEVITEPWSWKLSDLGIVFLIVTFISLFFLISSKDLVIKAISYIVFVCSTINSITIFSLKIYNMQEWRNSEEKNRDRVIEKVNKYFAGDFKISQEYKDFSKPLYPTRTLIIEKENKKYNVIANANNPNEYFQINEII